MKEKRALKHTDGEILTLEITSRATGEFIQEKLKLLSEQVGIPQQILADHGSNVKKGIQLYQKDYPQVIYTYDVTHGMSNLLKQQLSQDKNYQCFLEDCHKCRIKLQQTELAFLAPPSQRSQCRYFNVERLVKWGKQLLNVPLEVIVELMPQSDIQTIPLSTINFTKDIVKTALETIRGIDLEEWAYQVFGQSMLSKRKTLFDSVLCDTKTA